MFVALSTVQSAKRVLLPLNNILYVVSFQVLAFLIVLQKYFEGYEGKVQKENPRASSVPHLDQYIYIYI